MLPTSQPDDYSQLVANQIKPSLRSISIKKNSLRQSTSTSKSVLNNSEDECRILKIKSIFYSQKR